MGMMGVRTAAARVGSRALRDADEAPIDAVGPDALIGPRKWRSWAGDRRSPLRMRTNFRTTM